MDGRLARCLAAAGISIALCVSPGCGRVEYDLVGDGEVATSDATRLDGALVDAAGLDGGGIDAAGIDGAVVDGGGIDAAGLDGAVVDGGDIDAAIADAGSGDTGLPDAAIPSTVQRWARTFPTTTRGWIDGAEPDGAGGAVISTGFSGSIDLDGATLPPMGGGVNTIVLRVDAEGRTLWSDQLYAGFHCDMRTIDILPSGDVIAGGYSIGGSLGTGEPCDTGVGSPQDPTMLQYTGTGSYVARTLFDARSDNAQIWEIEPYADGSLAVLGLYGSALTIGGVDLPCCGGGFFARVGTESPWQYGLVGARTEEMDLDAGGELCVTGWLGTPMTILGTSLTPLAGDDAWVARVRADGTPVFVRSLGSTGVDQSRGIVATAGGGCTALIETDGDLVLGGAVGTIASMGANDVVVVELDAAGSATAAGVIGGAGNDLGVGLAMAAGALYAVVGLTSPTTIAGTSLTPAATDAVVVELDGVTPLRVVHTITGGGDLFVKGASARRSDLLVFGAFVGEIVSGSLTETSAIRSGFVVALSVDPR
jgi:hypothetical protein